MKTINNELKKLDKAVDKFFDSMDDKRFKTFSEIVNRAYDSMFISKTPEDYIEALDKRLNGKFWWDKEKYLDMAYLYEDFLKETDDNYNGIFWEEERDGSVSDYLFEIRCFYIEVMDYNSDEEENDGLL